MAIRPCLRQLHSAAIWPSRERWQKRALQLPLAVLGIAVWAAVRSAGHLRSAYVPEPPGPLQLRPRTKRLRDQQTGLPRAPPAEADVALDYFQRSFPGVSTQEHILIQRWERLSELFGGGQAANELVLKEPQILRVQ
eukprot:5670266-Amphidinium_carterae.1